MKRFQTTVSVKFRPSTVETKEGYLYFQFICNRKVRTVTTPYRIYPEEWNAKLSSICLGGESPRRERYLQEIHLAIRGDLDRLLNKIRRLERAGGYSLDHIISYYRSDDIKYFSEFVEELASTLENNRQQRLAEAYRVTANSLKTFNQGSDILLTSINSFVMEEYELYMKQKGSSLNTISFYIRNIRSVYNKAVKDGLIDRQRENPFQEVFTGVAKTRKRAVKQNVIKSLLQLKIKEVFSAKRPRNLKELKKSLTFSRDLFVLSFYLRGISFIDLAHLTKSNLSEGFITYVRCKTGQQIEIAVTSRISDIIGRYAHLCSCSDFLLPIMCNQEGRLSYLSALKRQNTHLKELSSMLGLEKTLTTYVSRHSWASIAQSKGYPISVISQGLGHESEKTTRIYLDSFDYSVLHKANSDITGS